MKTTSLWTRRIGVILVLAVLLPFAAAAHGDERTADGGGVQTLSTWST